MRPRQWLLLSIILYALALALPALQSLRPDPLESPMYGFHCFLFGLLYSFMIWPLVLWAPNAFLGTMWVRAWRKLPTKPSAWISIPWALFSLVFLFFMIRSIPREGAALWIAAIATGTWAAREAGRPD